MEDVVVAEAAVVVLAEDDPLVAEGEDDPLVAEGDGDPLVAEGNGCGRALCGLGSQLKRRL